MIKRRTELHKKIEIKCNVRFHNTYPEGSTKIQSQNISAMSSQQLEGICLGYFFLDLRGKTQGRCFVNF